jgi:hypothetical protein
MSLLLKWAIIVLGSSVLFLGGVLMIAAEDSFASRLAVIGRWSRTMHIVLGVAMGLLALAIVIFQLRAQ